MISITLFCSFVSVVFAAQSELSFPYDRDACMVVGKKKFPGAAYICGSQRNGVNCYMKCEKNARQDLPYVCLNGDWDPALPNCVEPQFEQCYFSARHPGVVYSCNTSGPKVNCAISCSGLVQADGPYRCYAGSWIPKPPPCIQPVRKRRILRKCTFFSRLGYIGVAFNCGGTEEPDGMECDVTCGDEEPVSRHICRKGYWDPPLPYCLEPLLPIKPKF